MRLNKKKISEIDLMLQSALHWHFVFIMQHDQDLSPEQRRRYSQTAKRWRKAYDYYKKIIKEISDD